MVEEMADAEGALHLDLKAGQRMFSIFVSILMIDLMCSAATRPCFALCPTSTLTKSPARTVPLSLSLFQSSRRTTFRFLRVLPITCTISRAMKRMGRFGWRRSSSPAFVIRHIAHAYILTLVI